VVSALQNKNQHVPYRNSRLTQVLQDSMGGTAKMVMLLHISPEQASAQESLGTCAFGVRAASVERSAPVRVTFDPTASSVRDALDSFATSHTSGHFGTFGESCNFSYRSLSHTTRIPR
jgi:kinesin family protein C2/C3